MGTPGKVLDAILRKSLKTSDITLLVIDEADEMLKQQGLIDQATRIRRYLQYSL